MNAKTRHRRRRRHNASCLRMQDIFRARLKRRTGAYSAEVAKRAAIQNNFGPLEAANLVARMLEGAPALPFWCCVLNEIAELQEKKRLELPSAAILLWLARERYWACVPEHNARAPLSFYEIDHRTGWGRMVTRV